MHRLKYCCLLILLLLLHINIAFGQDRTGVYVDKQGVLRWQQNNAEATFLGVNYTTPLAYAYRAHKALNADLEKAIDQDVYHLAGWA